MALSPQPCVAFARIFAAPRPSAEPSGAGLGPGSTDGPGGAPSASEAKRRTRASSAIISEELEASAMAFLGS